MSDELDVVAKGGGALGGLVGLGAVAKFIWDSVRSRKEQLEEKAEEARDKKLDALLAGQEEQKKQLSVVELELRGLTERLSTQAGQVAEAKARIEGISANHGGRLGAVEQALVEIRTKLAMLETPRRKR